MRDKPFLHDTHEREGVPGARLFAFFAGFDHLQSVPLFFLIGVGLLFVWSTGIQVGTPMSLGFFAKQLQWVGAGTVLWLLLAALDYRRIAFRLGTVLFYLAVLVLLVLVLFIGVRVNGAISWLDLPGVGARLQPSEFGKLAAILLLSAMFASPVFCVNRWWCFLLGVAVVALPAVLILLEPDFGSTMVFLPIFAGIVFAAGLRFRFVVAAIVLAAVIGGGLAANEIFRIHPLLKEYQRDRILVFINPESDLLASGYNQYQARLAVGSGGFMGKGVGEGTQNTLGFLPQSVSNNDFIFSVIAEETGFFGCVILIFAYLLLFWSVFRTAFISTDPFGRYIAIGVGCMMFTHCFVNIGMSVGLTPVTGVPLPFISYGGSFMLMGMASFGILQSVYRHRFQA